ncbi:Alpha/Beta hydrolase protein [Podospora didyma]|uniref:Alpha/Beta hydrolase protein n=1 Tax=Podospora didyma TaxID=330526 RepID=A0AAE0N4Q0_9PEZI|nr:Alpha/Beta hydrolase protein [Podospora didyma]
MADEGQVVQRKLSYGEAPRGFSDHAFKSNSGTELRVRVWPADPPPTKPAPVVVWTHGGGWIAGYHYVPPPWLLPGFHNRGYHLVSHNYRLCPQARIDDQVADCVEAVGWCRKNLPSILGQGTVDVDRYVLCGESAGAHLATLMTLHLPSPPPCAVINAYGVVDFFGLQVLEPAAGTVPQPWKGEFSDDELDAFFNDRDPNNVLTDAPAWIEPGGVSDTDLSIRWGTDFRCTRRVRLQAELLMYHTKRLAASTFLSATFHREKFVTDDEFIAFVRSMSPLKVLQDEGKERGYPPTAFLHGGGDKNVPIQQSYDMAETLRKLGVPVVECYEDGEPHNFDTKYTGPDVPGWSTYIQPIIDFVDKHVGHTDSTVRVL